MSQAGNMFIPDKLVSDLNIKVELDIQEDLHNMVMESNIKVDLHEIETHNSAMYIEGIRKSLELAVLLLNTMKSESNVRKQLTLSSSFIKLMKGLFAKVVDFESKFKPRADAIQPNPNMRGSLAWYVNVVQHISENDTILMNLNATDGYDLARKGNLWLDNDTTKSLYVKRMRSRFPNA